MLSESHEEYLELCALSTSGDLSDGERSRLSAHLSVCSSCREAKREYDMLADSVLPDVLAEQAADGPSWPKESEDEFLRRLEADTGNGEVKGQGTELQDLPPSLAALESTWRGVWGLYAAGVALSIALGITAYQYGTHRAQTNTAALTAGADQKYLAAQNEITSLEAKLSDTGRALTEARTDLSLRDRTLADLRMRFNAQSEDLSRLNSNLAELKRQSETENSADAAVSQQEAESARKMEQAEAENQGLKIQVQKLESQTATEKDKTAALQARVDELADALKQKEGELDQRGQLLAHDRDIRELMGARDLYMAEVYDVARSGETRKPYGRIFYTKEKSLVFYAYDLDQQAGIRNVNTFQAWGRRGPDPDRALKLGIFYQDNAAKKRWVMKCNDAKTLAQIDAVFVTVEPNSQSSRPSSKSLLFAYLRIDPNHP